MYSMRFDMRVPGKAPAEIADQYRTAIEMARWVDDKGPFLIGLPEHHASEDGYLPAPLILGSAMAAVTSNVRFLLAATLLPMYDPVRLAEEMIMLDHISRGRVSYVLGIGYRPVEYELYRIDYAARGVMADEKLAKLLDTLKRASDGESMPRVTPPPYSDGGPVIGWGGGSRAAARRAGRNGLGFFAQDNAPALEEAYTAAAREAGVEPGPCMLPSPETPNVVFVHPDPDRGWEEVGPYLLADARVYAEWNKNSGRATISLSEATTIEEMREENGAYRVVDIDGAVELIQRWGRLPLHPLCGGCPPELAWQYLHRVVDDVMPAVEKAPQ